MINYNKPIRLYACGTYFDFSYTAEAIEYAKRIKINKNYNTMTVQIQNTITKELKTIEV